MKLLVRKTTTNWRASPAETTVEHFEIQGSTDDEAFAYYFREFENHFKYCNNIQFAIEGKDQAKAYRAWISDVNNYAANGGDMY